jgi:hypothetical protein
MAAAAAAGLPLPAVHASTVWHERPALLLSWCDGQTLLRAVVEKPWHTWSLGVAMGLQQARIHAATVAETLSDALPPWIARAGETDYALKERLAGITRAPHTRALLHLDYHPLNIMTANGALTCVLDWANAAIGDPRADIARTVCLLRLAPTPPGTPTALGYALRLMLELAWRTGYRRAAGRLQDMPAFYAWAGSMMERDLAPKVGRPGVWLQPRDLARIHQWTVTWKRRAGLTAPIESPRGLQLHRTVGLRKRPLSGSRSSGGLSDGAQDDLCYRLRLRNHDHV